MVCSRKNSRKTRKGSRKNSRKNRRNTMRRNTMRRNNMNMMGGAGEPINTPSALSMAQGREYQEIHKNQHGGGSWSGAGLGAPVGYSGVLPQELVASARVGPTLQSLGEISGMRDQESAPAPSQTGGGRRRKGRKGSRKGKKSRKGSRRQRGGAYAPAPYNAPGMLLSAGQAAKAGTADFSNPLLKY